MGVGIRRTWLTDRVPGAACMEKVIDLATHGAEPEQLRPWVAGVQGEQETATVLAALDSTWIVLHAVPAGPGDADIDHIAIGPQGLFVINSKHHHNLRVLHSGDRMVINRKVYWEPRAAHSSAQRAAGLLSKATDADVSAVGVISLVCGHITRAPDAVGASVVPSTALATWLGAGPVVLTAEQITHLGDVAADPRTWGAPLSAPGLSMTALRPMYAAISGTSRPGCLVNTRRSPARPTRSASRPPARPRTTTRRPRRRPHHSRVPNRVRAILAVLAVLAIMAFMSRGTGFSAPLGTATQLTKPVTTVQIGSSGVPCPRIGLTRSASPSEAAGICVPENTDGATGLLWWNRARWAALPTAKTGKNCSTPAQIRRPVGATQLSLIRCSRTSPHRWEKASS